jgi:flagellum-specific peptidoglycan hydrolase FlgJ
VKQFESDFLRDVLPAALATQKQYGVPASITIAQAIAESGWGKSALAVQANNFFGIKAIAHTDPNTYVEFSTKEFVGGRKISVMADFAKYPSPVESFQAHAKLLSQASRYMQAMNERNDPAEFATQLQKCGYSTNPEYAAGLMTLVTEFDLRQYDTLPINKPVILPLEK